MIRFDKNVLSDFGEATTKEWLLTNGLGGYASSTIIGANTRKYHGLLVAASASPPKRIVMLSKLEETLILQKERFDLSCNQYPGIIHPEGHNYLVEFRLDPYPVFIYNCGKAVLEKSVFLIYGENAAVITYKLITSEDKTAALILRPLVACRDYHSVSYENEFFNKKLEITSGAVKMKPYEGAPELYLCHNAESFEQKGYWYRDFEYKKEFDRGLESHEDLYSPGQFVYLLREGEACTLIASLESYKAQDTPNYTKFERMRQASFSAQVKDADEFTKQMLKSADSFIIKRNGALSSAIAGYPWFSEWGRDALVSLPGLALSTGRYDIARSILETYGSYCDSGLIPAYFPETAKDPEYASVDASLWYFYAVGKYLEYTGDMEFVKKRIFGVLLEIIDFYIKGTRFGIHMNRDGLINFSERSVCLSWMDAMVEHVPCAPRFGKLVEVNALWYNALKVMQGIIVDFDKKLVCEYENLAKIVKDNFNYLFWNGQKQSLFDWINGDIADTSVRPNQIFALSLPHTMLAQKKESQILETVKNELLTPYGLRSLSPNEHGYQGHYYGDASIRDRAYHNGTTWPWLIGPYISAYLKV
ncbi:MAG: amylo-alpha-1,6-glucosidase, partial [Candidatus Omnitrophota bacterium]